MAAGRHKRPTAHSSVTAIGEAVRPHASAAQPPGFRAGHWSTARFAYRAWMARERVAARRTPSEDRLAPDEIRALRAICDRAPQGHGIRSVADAIAEIQSLPSDDLAADI